MKEKDQILLEDAYDSIEKKKKWTLPNPPTKTITYKWDGYSWKPVTKQAKPAPISPEKRPKGFFDLEKRAKEFLKKQQKEEREKRWKEREEREKEAKRQATIQSQIDQLKSVKKNARKRKKLKDQIIKSINPTGTITSPEQKQVVQDILDKKKREEDSRQKSVEDYIQHLHKKYNS